MVPRRSRSAFMLMVKVVSGIQQKDALFALGCGWMFSGRCLRVRPNTEVDPLYLYYFFCLEDTKQFVRNIAVGATMPSINTKLLGEVEVAYPSQTEQQKIVALLSALDDKIEINQKINDNLAA